MKNLLLTILLISISVFNLKAQSFDVAVTGGGPIQIQDAPYQVSIQYKSNGAYHCGGSIINNKYILTAGHCVTFRNGSIIYPSSMEIRSGISLLNAAGAKHTMLKEFLLIRILAVVHSTLMSL